MYTPVYATAVLDSSWYVCQVPSPSSRCKYYGLLPCFLHVEMAAAGSMTHQGVVPGG